MLAPGCSLILPSGQHFACISSPHRDLPASPLIWHHGTAQPVLCREAERARQAELREKAKEQLAALTAEAAEAMDEAKEAAAEAK